VCLPASSLCLETYLNIRTLAPPDFVTLSFGLMTCPVSWRQLLCRARHADGLNTRRFQKLYVLTTLCLCVLYLSENKQRLVPLTAQTDWLL
jgi:hypothetical protein